MTYELNTGGHTIRYTLRKYKRSKHLRISIGRGGEVLVTGPRHVPLRTLHAFVQTKVDWIIHTTSAQAAQGDPIFHHTDRAHFLEHKAAALALAEQKVAEWNTFYNFSHNRISVKQLSSRWGSCSSKKNLTFSYRILFLPPELQDYLVVHELCHLKEMNHSANFWALVEQTLPDYKTLRRALKKI